MVNIYYIFATASESFYAIFIIEIISTSQAMYRYFGGLRFLLALMVMAGHFSVDLMPPSEIYFHAIGYVAVVIFFIISGFVISEAIDMFYQNRRWDFLKNRLLRIYPPYLFALVVSMFLMSLAVFANDHGLPFNKGGLLPFSTGGIKNIIGNIFAIFDYRTAAKEHYRVFVRPIWSVVLEFQFYCFVAFGLRTKWALIICTIFYFIYWTMPSLQLEIGLGRFVPYLLMGVLLYYNKKKWALILGIVSSVNFFYSLDPSHEKAWQVALMICLMAMFWGLSQIKAQHGKLSKADSMLGNLSYPLYLNHAVIGIVGSAFFTKGWILFASGIFISIFISYLGFVLVDKPLKIYRNRVRGIPLN